MAGAYRIIDPSAFMPWDMKDRIQGRVANLKRIYGLKERREEFGTPDRPSRLQLAI